MKNRDYKEGPYCHFPIGVNIALGCAVAPCAARFDAWFYRGDHASKGSVGFRAWFVQASLSWR